jgi:hypothetical protein
MQRKRGGKKVARWGSWLAAQANDDTVSEVVAVLSLHWLAREGAGRLSRAAHEGGNREEGVNLVEKTPKSVTERRWPR